MLQLVSKRLILLVAFVLISLVATYSYIFVNTIELSEDDIVKDIRKRWASSVDIIQMTESRDDQFILFSNNKSGQLGMIYYKPHFLITNRYKFLGGSNIEGNADLYHKYSVYNFGQNIKKGYERLVVVYGRNEPHAERLELDFGEKKIVRDIDGKRYFLEVFRLEQEEFNNRNIRFLDSNSKDITEKFL